MTLTRRALRGILPVVLISNLVVALAVYGVQQRSIRDAEATRFAMRMKGLGASLRSDLDATRNLVFALRNGDALRGFVREDSTEFRAVGLGVKVEDAIRFFSRARNRFTSFAVIDPDLGVRYYFENSDDPFAEARPEQIALAGRVLAGGATTSDDFVETPDGGLLVHSEVIDRRTFLAPIATQREFAFVVQSATRPVMFEEMRRAIEADYRNVVKVSPPADVALADGQSYAEALTGALTLSASLPPAFLAGRLARLVLVLAAGSVLLSLLSVGLLVLLIRRTVTGPIAALDHELKEIIEGRREAMAPTRRGGEIGRLSVNIKRLHDDSLHALRQVRQMSWTDSLTGVSNRPRFHIVGQEWLGQAVRDRRPLALLFIDLDNFKYVNDTFGHAAGDAVLKAFTVAAGALLARLDQTCRETHLARLAGDEFAVLLKVDERTAVAVARALVGLFAEGLSVENTAYPVTASIGIALAPEHACAFDDLVSCADAAMYRAKAAGKNGCAVFSPLASNRAA